MSQLHTAEFRIHGGIHAGARAILTTGVYLIGADLDCDFVLCDPDIAARHASIAIDGDQWRIRLLTAAPDEEWLATDGLGLEIGPVLVSVEHSDAIWKTPDLRPISRLEPTGEISPAVEEPFELPPQSLSQPEIGPSPAVPRRSAGWRSPRPWTALLFLAVLGALILLVLFSDAQMQGTPAQPQSVASTGTEAEVQAILAELNLSGQARIQRRSDGRILVQAILEDDEYEKLAEALAKLNPRPELKVTGEQELIRAVRDVLATHDANLRAEYLGSGRFRLHGLVASDTERDALLKLLPSEFPEIQSLENALQTRQAMAEKLLAELRDGQVTEIDGQWQEDVFSIKARIAPDALPRWEQWLARNNEQYGRWLQVTLRSEANREGDLSDGLPFGIIGVVGGGTPFVILSDRRKVLLGGTIGGWRLAEITGEWIVFEGPRRVVVRR